MDNKQLQKKEFKYTRVRKFFDWIRGYYTPYYVDDSDKKPHMWVIGILLIEFLWGAVYSEIASDDLNLECFLEGLAYSLIFWVIPVNWFVLYAFFGLSDLIKETTAFKITVSIIGALAILLALFELGNVIYLDVVFPIKAKVEDEAKLFEAYNNPKTAGVIAAEFYEKHENISHTSKYKNPLSGRQGHCKYDHRQACENAGDIYIQFQMQRINDSHNNKCDIARELFKSYSNKAIETGINLLKESAEEGDAYAQLTLGCYYGGADYRMTGNVWNHYTMDNKEVNHAKEAYWFFKAAEQGSATGMYNLAICYSNGRGVEKSEEKEYYWCKKAALRGSSYCMMWLGDFYRDGVIETHQYYYNKKILDKNIDSALYWWNKAYETGDSSIKQQAEERLQKLYN